MLFSLVHSQTAPPSRIDCSTGLDSEKVKEFHLVTPSEFYDFFLSHYSFSDNDGVVIRASASQSVDLEFISLVQSCQKTLKNGIHRFFAWCSAFKERM